ncbi:MAG: hypothetical protein Q8754_02780, partial [Sweet potato little leaf phytoplasma]|nr:hypothetical protein [Sweet potato little leaf phytoplasma]
QDHQSSETTINTLQTELRTLQEKRDQLQGNLDRVKQDNAHVLSSLIFFLGKFLEGHPTEDCSKLSTPNFGVSIIKLWKRKVHLVDDKNELLSS